VSAEAFTLEAVDLSRRYGRRWVVRHVGARFEAGTLSLFVGANGAGKTTLLRMLAGTLRPTDGEVRVAGHALGESPDPAESRRSVALLGHEPGCYADLSGSENLALFAGLYDRPRDPATLEAHLERVGLGGVGRRPTSAYSRGMLQRLGLARILVQDASIWLMDEPTTGLDEAGRTFLRDVFREARSHGRTIVAITHDVGSFGDTVDHVYRLERGRLVEGAS
jgi:heme ABC exporter ATP-binding subunit CcmA